jgi:RNA polymerase sigma factor (sigma-70 family)
VASREWRTTATEDATLERISDAETSNTNDGDPLRAWEKQTENEALWHAFDRLPDDYREVLYLHHCEEWPLSRIAGFFSVPETTIKGKLWRARQALKKLLIETSKDV